MKTSRDEDVKMFANELQSNGLQKFYKAFTNSELDYFEFYETLSNEELTQFDTIIGVNYNQNSSSISSDGTETKKNVVLIKLLNFQMIFLLLHSQF